MGKPFDLTPRDVPPVETNNRRIVSPIPHPEAVALIERLQRVEPLSMGGQPPIIWDRADGVHVEDRWGNRWLDFSSGVLVANAGHGHPALRDAVMDQAEHGPLHNYCFPSELRLELCEQLAARSPAGLSKVFLLTTGSEATECALKLIRTAGRRIDDDKRVVVSFVNAFHGRTLGAQQIGGLPALKEWIGELDPAIVQVPFPDGFRVTDTSFGLFERSLAEQGVEPARVAGVIVETYQGVGPDFLPVDYAQALRRWCDRYQAVLCFDEVQAGFGRCGTFWGFERYGVVPDLICAGKGITSSLPLSAVIGRPELMDLYEPGTMTSTHTGNPLCCRAAIANLKVIDGLVANAARLGPRLAERLETIRSRHPERIGAAHSVGLVAGLQMVVPGGQEPDPDAAHAIIQASYERGLLFFAPVGVGGGCVKICPPLCLTAEQLNEGCDVLAEAVEAVLGRTDAQAAHAGHG